MAEQNYKELQLRRGTGVENAAFTGKMAEPVYLTDTKEVAVHDGSTPGGTILQNKLTFDSTPTTNSNNPVTSDGVYDALATKQDKLTFDSTPTADSNNPVTSQGIKAAIDAKDSLPSQTGNAGKVLATDGTAASWIEPPSGRQILETFYTFRTDVGPINGAYDANGTVYNRSDFSGGQNPYDLLVAGKAKSCSFAEYETQLSTYGSCGLFGLDTETQRFRVPTLKNILEPTVLSSAIGQIVEAGLPNITGGFDSLLYSNTHALAIGLTSGSFYSEKTKDTDDYIDTSNISTNNNGHNSGRFDASRSSPVYGKSTTVQPQTIKVRPMVQLATAGQEISIEQYSNQLADYAQTYTLNGRIIGEFIWAGLPLTNAGVHLLDGSEISNSGIYTQFVSYISSCFEDQNPQAKWLKTKGITLPTFSANTQNGITISDARGNTTDLQAIFNGTSESVSIGKWTTYWINIDYAQNTLLSSYTIQADNYEPAPPSDWKLQGSNDGTAWTDIHSKTSIIFGLNQAKTFSVDQTVPYKQYRLLFSNGVADDKFGGELKKVSFSASEVEFGYENSMFATEEQWQACVAKYGSCGKFVFSSSGVRLPKVSDILQGTTDVTAVGDLIEAGLPNITGAFGAQIITGDNGDDSGAITSKGLGTANLQYVSSGTYVRKRLYINASLSSPIYGNSTTVQPQTIKALLYICVANSVKTQIQVDIDNIATDLNSKAKRDLSNVTGNAVERVVASSTDYVRYESGLQICWGKSNYKSDAIVTYPKPFADLPGVSLSEDGRSSKDWSKTNFKLSGPDSYCAWIAIGRWTDTQGITTETVNVTPKISAQTITPSDGYNYISQVNVAAIPYTETDNSAGGKTVSIADFSEVP